MKQEFRKIAAAVSLVVLVAAGCTSSTDSSRIENLEKTVAALKADVDALKAGAAKTASTSSNAPNVVLSSNPAPSAPVLSTSKFVDIKDRFGEAQISDLARLEVLDGSTQGEFEPTKICTRRDFLRWLVKSNNALMPDANKIRLAEPDTKPTFPDVPATDPDFKFIQGTADAGYTIGFRDKTFKPDKELTREEMIALKGPLDYGVREASYQNYAGDHWNDASKISKDFWNSWNNEGANLKNIPRIYGQIKSINPKKPVTRAEAAICIWQIKDNKASQK